MGSYDEYQAEESELNGIYAEPGSKPFSIFSLMCICGVLGSGVTYFLNRRKERILNEIYSKISIVNR